MRRLLLAACWGALLVLSACTGSEAVRHTDVPPPPYDTLRVEAAERLPEPAAVPAPPAPAVARLITDALRTDGRIDRTALLRRLGPPLRTTVEPVSNLYRTHQTDSVRTITYPGLQAILYETRRPARIFLIRLVLTDSRYASPEGLRVGMLPRQVVAAIGPPTERDRAADELIYAEHNSMPTALILTLHQGRVAAIAWEFYFS